MKKIFQLKIFAIFTAIILFTSCVRDLEMMVSTTPKVLVPRNVNYGYFNFVVPGNFRFLAEDSLIYYYNGDVRAYLLYEGKASLTQLVNFFNDYMTEKGWEANLNMVSTDGIMTFKKGSRLIVIKLNPKLAGVMQIRMLLTK
jgi:hypothetical protein